MAQASAMEIGEGLLRLLTSAACDACVLVLEDLHWSDPDTTAVVEYVADNLQQRAAFAEGSLGRDSDHAGELYEAAAQAIADAAVSR